MAGLGLHRLIQEFDLTAEVVVMAKPIGPSNDAQSPLGQRSPSADKKKGCKQSKCSHWKGGKCRCGRD